MKSSPRQAWAAVLVLSILFWLLAGWGFTVCSDKNTHIGPAPLNTDDVRKQLESLELTDAQRQFLESVLKNEPADKTDDAPAGEHDEEDRLRLSVHAPPDTHDKGLYLSE